MFCGNRLAGGTVTGSGKDNDRKQEDSQRWDPETVYVQSKGKAIAILAALIVLIACVAVVFLTQSRTPGAAQHAFAAPLGTPGATRLEEMTKQLRDAGMQTTGDPYEFDDTTYQRFAPFVILDEETGYSVAALQAGTEIAVAHIFNEKRGTYSIRKAGPVFLRLLEKLTKKYGKPVIRGTQDYYYWTDSGDMLVLYYAYNGEIRLEFHEGIPDASV